MTPLQQSCRHGMSALYADGTRRCATCCLLWSFALVIIEDRRQRALRDREAKALERPQLVIVVATTSGDFEDAVVVNVDEQSDETQVMFGPPEPMLAILVGTGIKPRMPAPTRMKAGK